jgi:carboxyl-terminal processing protease
MSRRNLLVLLAVMLLALLCYQRMRKNVYARVLASTMATIENRYLEPIESSQLFERAMDGMLGNLDDYSAYISPADLQQFHEAIDQEFCGIGVEVALDPQTKQLMVLCPLLESPAYKAGVRAGDRIVRIHDASTQGMSLEDASNLLRGKPGDSVTISVLHEGEEKPVEVAIVREVIPTDTVRGDTRNADGSWNFFLEGDDRIGYVRISSFSDNTVGKFEQALDWLVEHKMRGLVLDLRDDPGGYVDAAIDVCNLLVRSGVIVSTRGRNGSIGYTAKARGDAPFTDFPMAVLIDQNSASAAEIVAACLQDHHRATIVGQRSYGKGTIQEIVDLEGGCGAMKLTTASYWRPSGKSIARPHNAGPKDIWGVMPDENCEVVLKDDEFNRWQSWRFHRDMFHAPGNGADSRSGDEAFVDRPLVRAVEYLVSIPNP